jgi:hypothetical protein
MARFAWSLVCALVLSGCPDPNPPAPSFDFAGIDGLPVLDGSQIPDMTASDQGGDGAALQDLMLPPLDGPKLPDDAAVIDPGGPTITVLTPMQNGEVKGNTLLVRARIVAQAMRTLVADSIKLSIPKPGGGTSDSVLSLTGVPDVYEGQADISALSGNTNLSVTAKDNTDKSNTVFVDFFIDKGPRITFKQPVALTAKGSVSVEVEVLDLRHPVRITPSPSDITMTVRPGDNLVFTVTDISPTMGTAPYLYRAVTTINFNDAQYNPPLDGPQLITVEAVNTNMTKGIATKQFTVDNAGPTIVITGPIAGEFVGGVVTVKATITDISPIVPASVVAVFANDPANHKIPLNQTMAGSNDYQGLFDVRGLNPASVLPSVSVRADDVLGNHGEVAHQIIVDSTRPSMELDPPQIRLRKQSVTVGEYDCSALFDPVGADAANDGATVNQLITLRARIEDHGNVATGLAVERFSGIEKASVTLFAIPAVGPASLVVDVDGDGMCDDINPKLVPTPQVTMSGQALALQMVEIPTNGQADFRSPLPKPPATAPWDQSPLDCTYFGDASNSPPVPLCSSANTPMTIAIPRFGDSANPIWTLPPVTTQPTGCVGFQLDSLNTLPEGPTCVAVRARDKAGNVNVSPPIRICIERTAASTACDSWNPAMFDCAGRYIKTTDTVNDAQTCAPFNSSTTITGGAYAGQPVFMTRFRSLETRNSTE